MSYQSGMDAFKAGNYQEAADAFRECVESDEDNHKAWNSLGVVYTKTGHYEAADTCYENALSLAPGTAAYERNRDKNKAKIVEPVEDILSVEDDGPKDWKIPGPEDKPKPAAKPTSSAKVTKTTPQYSIKQYAIAGIALIFLILIGAACVNMVGGGSSDHKQVQSQPVNVVNSPVQTIQVTQQITAAPTAMAAEAYQLSATNSPAGNEYNFSGSGSTSTDMFLLKAGLATFSFHAAGNGIFQVYLKDSNGDLIDIVANGQPPFSGSDKANIPADGEYFLDFNAYAATWTATITQSGYKEVQSQPVSLAGSDVTFQPTQQVTKASGFTQTFSGTGSTSTDVFHLDKGMAVFNFESTGESIFQAYLKHTEDTIPYVVANGMNPQSGTKRETISKSGDYYLDMNGGLSVWTITVSQ